MFKYFALFLVGHMLGDYYLQSDKLAKRKNSSLIGLMQHSVIYAIAMMAVIIPVLSPGALASAAALSVAHFALDFIKTAYIRRKSKQAPWRLQDEGWLLYLMDQGAHIACMLAAAFILSANGAAPKALAFAADFFRIVGISAFTCLKWFAVLLFIWKPANVTIKRVLSRYKPEEALEPGTGVRQAGALIGLLERLIMVIFLSINQYAAIGLVLTAKSIARYDRICKEKDFAEYYLLGTLLSALLSILAYILIF